MLVVLRPEIIFPSCHDSPGLTLRDKKKTSAPNPKEELIMEG